MNSTRASNSAWKVQHHKMQLEVDLKCRNEWQEPAQSQFAKLQSAGKHLHMQSKVAYGSCSLINQVVTGEAANNTVSNYSCSQSSDTRECTGSEVRDAFPDDLAIVCATGPG